MARKVQDKLSRAAKIGEATEDEKLLETEAEETLFLQTDPWRVMRITGEFVEGIDALASLGRAVSIFGSARVPDTDPMYRTAVDVARLLGEAGFSVITGGGPGIMQAGNEGARLASARSVGLNIELPFEQRLNPFVDISVDFRYFFVLKTMFVKYSWAFVIFPGGFGTMDELFESLVLIQTGKLKSFPVILYSTAYWKGLVDWMRATMLAEGKIAEADLGLLEFCDTPEEVVQTILRSANDLDSQRATEEEAARRQTKKAFSDLR